MKIEWKVSDGYFGHGSQYAEIGEDDLADCETEEEVEDLILVLIEDEFEYRVTFEYTDKEIQKVKQQWRELRARQAEDEDGKDDEP